MENAIQFIIMMYAHVMLRIEPLERGAGFEFVKFCAVNIVSLGVNLLALQLLVSYAGIIPEIAQIIAIFCSLVVNFSGNKWWTFRNRFHQVER